MTWGQDFLSSHMGYLSRGDIDGLMREHYHDDAEMVTFEFVAKGKEAIKQYLTTTEPTQAGAISGLEVKAFAESEDCILFTALVRSEKMGDFVARDALYVQGGKVLRHIALTLPPGTDLKSQWREQDG